MGNDKLVGYQLAALYLPILLQILVFYPVRRGSRAPSDRRVPLETFLLGWVPAWLYLSLPAILVLLGFVIPGLKIEQVSSILDGSIMRIGGLTATVGVLSYFGSRTAAAD